VKRALEEIREALTICFAFADPREMQFTWGRPYEKDDNAQIEQKDWTHVRRILGYIRYDTELAREVIDDLYRNEPRRFQNLFLSSVRFERKERVGSRLQRQRVAASQKIPMCYAFVGACTPVRKALMMHTTVKCEDVPVVLRSLSMNAAGYDLPSIQQGYYDMEKAEYRSR
jgi:hypothetical protein